MLNKEQCQTLIVAKFIQAKSDAGVELRKHILAQIQALVAVIAEQSAIAFEEVPDLLEMAEIPFIDHENGELSFYPKWLIDHGFNIDNKEIPTHPIYNNRW